MNARYVKQFAAVITAMAMLLCFIPMRSVSETHAASAPSGDINGTGTAAEYETKVFDTEKPLSVEIDMDAKQWKKLLKNAAEKKWQSCDVTINGTKFKKVGIRTKGSSSLESIAESPNCDRYSFKLKFDKYNDNQRCWGLDKLCLNNNYGDATNMKDALVYDMFRFMGGEAPLYNFAKISVNGNYWGVYLALEAVDQSFLERNYGRQTGACYKPGEGGDADENWDESEWENWDESEWNEEEGDSQVMGGGSDLEYIDDNPDSYFALWPSQVNKTNASDHARVVKALKHINDKDSLEQYMDMDSVLKYMAVHNFSVNYDSLSGEGDHNYYLHEKDGKLSLIPWDYNLCFGAYSMESETDDTGPDRGWANPSDIVNSPIDDHWRLTDFFTGILDDKEYLARYHAYYQKLIDEYVLGGGFDTFYSRTRAQINELVKTDPNAFYTYEAYDAGAKMLKKTVYLRGQSIKGQLNGTIPSTAAEQKKHPEQLIKADGIRIEVMGSDMIGPEPDKFDEMEQLDENAGWDEEAEWKALVDQQKQQKRSNMKKNGLQYGISLLAIAAALVAVRRYRRR